MLGDITIKVGSGATPRGGKDVYKSAGIPLIRSMNVHFNGFRTDGLAYIDDKQAAALSAVEVNAGDVLLNITGASIGRVTVAPPNMEGARVNQHVCIIRPTGDLDPSFLRWFLASPDQQDFILNVQSGATRQALTKQKILEFRVPLPPISVQFSEASSRKSKSNSPASTKPSPTSSASRPTSNATKPPSSRPPSKANSPKNGARPIQTSNPPASYSTASSSNAAPSGKKLNW